MKRQTSSSSRSKRSDPTGVVWNLNGDKAIAAGLHRARTDVVALVRKGMINKEITAEMYVSEKAVEYHLRNVYGKLGISSRRELRLQD